MNYKTLTYNVVEQIAYVALNRPDKHNAVDKSMFDDLNAVTRQIKKDSSLRAVIVSGNGEDFCSGIDIKSLFGNKKDALTLLFKWLPWRANLAQKVSTAWRDLPIPVIFALHGRCWGAGLQIALGADFRIATPATSISIMEARWGLIPDMGGTLALREVLRLDVAKELAMTAKVLSGEQALQLGLITQIADDPLAQANVMAKELSIQSPDAVAACKKLYNKSWWSSSGMALARETLYQIKIILGKNYRIKGYNQTHEKSEHKSFLPRMKW